MVKYQINKNTTNEPNNAYLINKTLTYGYRCDENCMKWEEDIIGKHWIYPSGMFQLILVL